MDIVLCADNNYVPYCGITLLSLLKNNKEKNCNIHIIQPDFTEESKAILNELASKYKQNIYYYTINEEYVTSLFDNISLREHISLATYIRLFLPTILPQSLDKVIYLDCDLIVRKDLKSLWNIDITNYSVGVVVNSRENRTKQNKRLGLGDDIILNYFNAGVILINLAYWRKNNTEEELLLAQTKLSEKKDALKWADQDLLNYVLWDSKLLVPLEYNVSETFYKNIKSTNPLFQKEIEKAIVDPCIIHYTTSMKPWVEECQHPLVNEFLKYKEMSPWKDLPSISTLKTDKDKRKYKFKQFLIKMGLKKRKYRKTSLAD